MGYKARNVFVPGAFPEHTYVERSGERLEQLLRDALDTPGQLVSLSGPSKSGKTVLVEKVVGRDDLIQLSGAGIRGADDVWTRVLDWMNVPHSSSVAHSVEGAIGSELTGKATVGIPLLARGETSATGSLELTGGQERTSVRERRGLSQVVKEIAGSSYVVLIDDFHYMERATQEEVARSLKEAIRLGVKVVTAAVRHRGDDVVRALPELRGRVFALDLTYWHPKELREIADRGFALLNAQLPQTAIDTFVEESAGSPQLMQSLCLQSCFFLSLREGGLFECSPPVAPRDLREILEQTSARTDFRSLVDVLETGPKTRGTERKTFAFTDGSKGDVYRCVLKAIAADPPLLTFPYGDLLARTVAVCDGESPVGSSVTTTCVQLSKLAREKLPNERAIDWDEQKQILDIPDPYLLFYLRWSGRLQED